MVKGAIRVGDNAIGFGPVSVGSSVEWAFEPERVSELRQVSHQTNGRELLNLEDAWLRPPYVASNSLSVPLGIALLLMVLLDALITRTGWKLPEFGKREKASKQSKPKKVKAEKPAVQKAAAADSKPTERPTEVQIPSERRSRFQRAKDKK